MKYFFSIFALSITFISNAQNIPVDFEPNGNGANWSWVTFENDNNPSLEIVANPDPTGYNTSATVAKFTALQSGQPFAGCETTHGTDIGSFTIDNTNSIIRITVWKNTISDVGVKLVRSDNWSLGEIKIPNTKTGEWEQLEFDFSAHVGNTYDQIVVFPDFSPRSQDNIIYFDDLYGEIATSTGLTKHSIKSSVSVYPNPASRFIQLQSDQKFDSYTITNFTGQVVLHGENNGDSSINIEELKSGIYLINLELEGGNQSIKFVKE